MGTLDARPLVLAPTAKCIVDMLELDRRPWISLCMITRERINTAASAYSLHLAVDTPTHLSALLLLFEIEVQHQQTASERSTFLFGSRVPHGSIRAGGGSLTAMYQFA